MTETQAVAVLGSSKEPLVSFHFISDLPQYKGEKLYEIWRDTEPGIAKSNCEFALVEHVKLQDMRNANTEFEFDTTGFRSVHAPSKSGLRGADCQNEGHNARLDAYLQECISLAKSQFNASNVICFDWRYRRSNGQKDIKVYDHTQPERTNALNAAYVVHFGRQSLSGVALVIRIDIPADDSRNGGNNRLRRYLSEKELERFDRGEQRIRFVNIWRPLIPVVEAAPLALCDRQSVHPDDILECDKIHDDHVGEGLYIKYRPWHRWYWLPHQTNDEALMFLTWDSKWDPEVPAGPPHAAFENPLAPASCPQRQSIEVRLMVFTEETRKHAEDEGTK
ncbi:hypothetical protein F5B20DRAFT_581002 [Whalleya microplaca]|nr:hypothetical protein F5B20DRAFT_581002 [Whalleya microplaca]